tara:strand:+ start:147011 stop:147895 length:885 start_codon:yes stop_codon:yes gene_type:complete
MFLQKAMLLLFSIVLVGCNTTEKETKALPKAKERNVSNDFDSYWFQGQAEITSYALQQERYGEMREGTAVLVYVTEDFLPEIQVKADAQNPDNITVLKLNKMKNFTTGIYPYSIMTSTFSPVFQDAHAIKVSNSVQEWCGHVYAQINNRERFEVTSHSYFENEADESFTLEKTWLEDELWTLLRIDPALLPQGDIEIIPSLEYTRLRHKEIKASQAKAVLTKTDSLSNYTVNYPTADRTLRIWFATEPPFTIEKWEEQIANNTTKAQKLNDIKSDYWNKNQIKHEVLRDSLFNN